jgi:hypothetical protein
LLKVPSPVWTHNLRGREALAKWAEEFPDILCE